MNNAKIISHVKGFKQNTNENQTQNDVSMADLKSKYEILEENFIQLLKAVEESKEDLGNFEGKSDHLKNVIDDKAAKMENNVGSSIQKMNEEIGKSLSHQKAENSRLEQQITQLTTDENVIKNQLLIVQRRIDDIQLQIGQKY